MCFLIRSQIKSKSSITCMGFFLTRDRFFQQKPRSKKNLLNFIKKCLKVHWKCYRADFIPCILKKTIPEV